MQNITILGSTGSIGASTLAIIRNNATLFKAYALTGGKNVGQMTSQCQEFRPKYVAMSDPNAAVQLKKNLSDLKLDIEVLSGEQALCELAALPEVHQVMAAIVGIAGLKPTLAAIKKGKRILLANKESLITCGSLFIQAIKQYGAELLPVDSEHNAIYQSLPLAIQQNLGFANLSEHGVTKIILTGSGGPFRNKAISQLNQVTAEQAIRHPNWSMGKKISVDSATMMNKGLEFIEARWLFNAQKDDIEIIIHPQSIIHSMVRYQDGSVIAQLGNPDMCTPIAYAMAYPYRVDATVTPLDFTKLSQLTFEEPNYSRYPCLKLAIEASEQGQAATTVLNAANEIAVDSFLQGHISFMEIATSVRYLVEKQCFSEPKTIDDIFEIDRWTRDQDLTK